MRIEELRPSLKGNFGRYTAIGCQIVPLETCRLRLSSDTL